MQVSLHVVPGDAMSSERDQGRQDGNDTRQPNAEFDQLTDFYEERIEASLAFTGMEHAFYIDRKREKIVSLARSRFDDLDRLSVLDLGCGMGAYHPGLKGVFAKLYGADVSVKSIALAAERNPEVAYSTVSGNRLPYPDRMFDIVYSVCVMHHVIPSEWAAFASEIKRVLHPSGLALVFEHNPYNPATQYIVRTCEIDRNAVLIKPRQLRAIFQTAGFDSLCTRTMFSVPPVGTVLTTIDSLFGRLPFGAQYYLVATNNG